MIRTRPWAAIVRVPTAYGDVWFKENEPGSAFEPALTLIVARRRPDCAPEVLAGDRARILTRDAGQQLRDVLDSGVTDPSWEQILPLYGELQASLTADVEDALTVGTPDLRPERLPALYDDLIERLGLTQPGPVVSAVRGAAELLSTSAVPLSIAHQEVSEGNVFVRDRQPVFLDWAESCVSHPFVGSVLALRAATERGGHKPGSPEVEQLRDLYLQPFTRFDSLPELRRTFMDAYLLGAVARALSWDAGLAGLAPHVRSELGDPISGWLEIVREIATGQTRLGGA